MSSRLECKNLTKDYGNVMALSDVNLTLESGRIVGLLGPNGSGKTTLIKLANGLLQPTSGEILLNGLKPGPETKAFVSYLPDANYLPDWLNVEALVGMFDDFLALGTFTLGIAEFIIEGIITDIAHNMHVSIPEAGHLISVYALGVCAGAFSLILMHKYRPKHTRTRSTGQGCRSCGSFQNRKNGRPDRGYTASGGLRGRKVCTPYPVPVPGCTP